MSSTQMGAAPGPSFHLIRSLVRQSAVYGLMDLVGRAGALVLVPLYTHALGAEDYGNLELFVVSQGFLIVLGTLGFNSALTKYYVLAADPAEARAVFGTALTWTLGWGLGLLALCWAAAPRLAALVQHDPAAAGSWRILAATVFCEAVVVMVLSLFRSQERPFRFAAISLTRLFTTLGTSVVLVAALGMGLRGALLGVLAGNAVALALGLAMVRSYYRPGLHAAWVRSLWQLGFPLALGGLAMFFLNNLDRYFINAWADAGALGVYALANRIAVLMVLVVSAFMMAWPPVLFRIVKEPGARETLSRVITYFLAVASFVLLALGLGAREIVHLVAPPEFAGAAPLVTLLVGANLLYGVYYLFNAGPVLTDRTRYIPFLVGAAAAAGAGANWVLVREWAAPGAAWARLGAYVVLAALTMAASQRLYRIPIAWRRLLTLAALVAVLLLAARAVEPWATGPRIAAKALLLLVYAPGLFLAGVLDRDERRRLFRLVRRRLGAGGR